MYCEKDTAVHTACWKSADSSRTSAFFATRHDRSHTHTRLSIADESGKVFKAELKAGKPKMGLFLNSGSPTIAEQLSCAGYDWLLVDAQHGPMNPET